MSQSKNIRRVCWTLSLLLLTAGAAVSADLDQKLTVSTEVYEELYGQEGDEQKRIIADAVCISVIPYVIKGALGVGGRRGTGVISCKNDGQWSPPAFVTLSGGSLGFQAGGEVIDLVLFFMTKRGVESLLETEFTLGADASVAAGPFGRTAKAGTDLKFKAEIYSYAKSRGLFAGLSLEGAYLDVNQKAIRKFYGERIWPEEILFEHDVPKLPATARAFIAALPGGD